LPSAKPNEVDEDLGARFLLRSTIIAVLAQRQNTKCNTSQKCTTEIQRSAFLKEI